MNLSIHSLKPALTVKEFAEYFGRSLRWAYDRVYLNEVSVLASPGVTMIPSQEIDRYLNNTKPYDGKRQSKNHGLDL
jgi:hypothetical protein